MGSEDSRVCDDRLFYVRMLEVRVGFANLYIGVNLEGLSPSVGTRAGGLRGLHQESGACGRIPPGMDLDGILAHIG